LNKLPDIETTVYRGIPKNCEEKIRKEYKLNRPIHWSGLSSATELIAVAKSFAEKDGILFKIKIHGGKDIAKYSFVPAEDEILLSPNMKFKVKKPLFPETDGYQYVELEQEYITFVF